MECISRARGWGFVTLGVAGCENICSSYSDVVACADCMGELAATQDGERLDSES